MPAASDRIIEIGRFEMKNVDPKQGALDAIGDEAEKLLDKSLSPDVLKAVEQIISIARHGFDVRTDAEQKAGRT